MQKLKNMKIGPRLFVGFMIIAIISAAIGVIGIINLQTVTANYNLNYTASLEALDWVEQMSSSFERSRMDLYGVVLSQTKEDKEFYLAGIDDCKARTDEAIAGYRAILQRYDPAEVAHESGLLDAIETKLSEYRTERDTFVSDYAMDFDRQQKALDELKNKGSLRTIAGQAEKAIEDLMAYNIDYGKNINSANQNTVLFLTIFSIILIVIGFGFAVLTARLIGRAVEKPINELIDVAEKLAQGDISVRAEARSTDEIGMLMQSFNRMIENIRAQALTVEMIADGDFTVEVEMRSENDLLGRKLKELVQKLHEMFSNIVAASDQIASGSKQISDSSMVISQGATEQASSVEELSATIEEIAAQTKMSAASADQTNVLTKDIEASAAEGTSQMQEMLKAMAEINVSSTNINKIIKVIEDIAFQTNILALNAAVEAARAGEYGKGFAVVAEEVRTLASRSADAAKDTTQLIEESIQKVHGGSKIANQTAAALSKIVDGVDKAGKLVGEIANATNEQATGIFQVSEGINQISAVVQANSATSEETAATSEELSGQADMLKHMVDQFKIK